MTAPERDAVNEDAKARGLSVNDYVRLILRRAHRERAAKSGPVVEVEIE